MEITLLVLTILLSAGFAGLVTHRLNVCKQRLSFRAQKAEELYCEADQVESALSRFFASAYSLVGVRASSVELSSENREMISQHLSRLKMLIGFYYPQLRVSLARVIAAASSAYAMLEIYQAAERQEKERSAQTLDTSVVDLKDALSAMKSHILQVGEQEHTSSQFVLLKHWRRPNNSATRAISVAS